MSDNISIQTLEDIVSQLISLDNPTKDDLLSYRKKYAGYVKMDWLPSNTDIMKIYWQMIDQWTIAKNKIFETLLKKRAVRSISGIVPVQVLTKPFWCPGECIFCPNDATMPKSYINTEPWAQRALLNNFDPYKQVYNRLLSLRMTWHPTDKIEMIVLWWTRDVYPHQYKVEFIKWLYDACNTFDTFFAQYTDQKQNNIRDIWKLLENMNITYPSDIEESIIINQTAWSRIIWLTLETRPEYVTDENCLFWREIWVTRIEMGIQSMFDDVLDANKRWHSIEQCKQAMYKLRQYGFKISVHLMPGLYGSTIEKDIQTFEIAFSDPAFCPDELKFYPTAVIPNTPLFDMYKNGQYTPLTLDQSKYIIKTVLKNHIPPYTRIKRLVRDIPADETVWSNYVTNLRQLVENELSQEFVDSSVDIRKQHYHQLYLWSKVSIKDKNDLFHYIKALLDKMGWSEINQIISHIDQYKNTFVLEDFWFDIESPRQRVSMDTRSREIRDRQKSTEVYPIVRTYPTTNGLQLFISWEDKRWYLYWFTRLQLWNRDDNLVLQWLGSNTAIIRELHVYGQMASIWWDSDNKTQHQGIWSQLMELAQDISSACWYSAISVISGVWVRWYYEKLGYKQEGTYMIKGL